MTRPVDLEEGPIDHERSGLTQMRTSFLRPLLWLADRHWITKSHGGNGKAGIDLDSRTKGSSVDDGEDPYTKGENEDACGKLWSVYIDEAERYDTRMVERWKDDMDGMLIFSGLYSASLTAFLIESYKNLQANSGEETVALLRQISLQLAAASTGASETLVASEDFRPTTVSIICNVLWFLSLALSLTCALLATLIKQWARDFLDRTETRASPVKRARMISFVYFGLKRFRMHTLVDMIPMLLHASLLFFFAGLVAFLVPVNSAMTWLMVAVLSSFLLLYLTITVLPLMSLDSPYFTPLSEIFWQFWRRTRILLFGQHFHVAHIGMSDALVVASSQETMQRDEIAVQWTLASMTDDSELLNFVEAIPYAIFGSKGLRSANAHLFFRILQDESDNPSINSRTLDLLQTSNSVFLDDASRIRRQTSCLQAIWAIGMITDTRPLNFHANPIRPDFWNENYKVDEILSAPDLDQHYVASALAVVRYRHLCIFNQWINQIEHWLPEHVDALTMIPAIYKPFRLFSQYRTRYLPSPLYIKSLFHSIVSSNLVACSLLTSPKVCNAWKITIMAGYLDDSLKEEALPHEFDLTWELIYSKEARKVTLTIPEQKRCVRDLFRALSYGEMPTAASKTLSDVPQPIDKIMAAVMDMISCLASSIFGSAPLDGLYNYIAKRDTETTPNHFIKFMQRCRRPHLLECVIEDAKREGMTGIEHRRMSHAICDLLVLEMADFGISPLLVHAANRLLPVLYRQSLAIYDVNVNRTYQFLIFMMGSVVLQGLDLDFRDDITLDLESFRNHPLLGKWHDWDEIEDTLSPPEVISTLRSRISRICMIAILKYLDNYASEYPSGCRFLEMGLQHPAFRDVAQNFVYGGISADLQRMFAKAILAVCQAFDRHARSDGGVSNGSSYPSEVARNLWCFTRRKWLQDDAARATIADAWRSYRMYEHHTEAVSTNILSIDTDSLNESDGGDVSIQEDGLSHISSLVHGETGSISIDST